MRKILLLTFGAMALVSMARILNGSLVADFNDDRILVGSSHDVFIAKVLKRLGNAPIDHPVPHTRFQVEVIATIKGNLQGEIFIDQAGGYRGSTFIVADWDVIRPGTDEAMLKPGSTYVFATRSAAVNPEKCHRLISHPKGHALVTADAKLSKEQLRTLVEGHTRVKELKEAYRNQTVPDVFKKDARNPYPVLPKLN